MSDLAVSFSQPERIAGATLHIGDCLDVLPRLAAEGFRAHAVVTDPPYHLTTGKQGGTGEASLNLNSPAGRSRVTTGFMGKAWDGGDVAFRPETWAAVRECMLPGAFLVAFASTRGYHRMVCAIEDAGFVIHPMLGWVFASGFPKATRFQQPELEGWRYGLQALKPALEPICVAQRPLDGTGSQNWAKHGCGGLNIDASRVHAPDALGGEYTVKRLKPGATLCAEGGTWRDPEAPDFHGKTPPGRWPANLLHDGSPEVEQAFAAMGADGGRSAQYYDTGSASRFFFTAKADARDRAGSRHPTVKPASLMRWLVRLVCPEGGTILDPFAGTGSTGLAADQCGMRSVLIEREPTYAGDALRKIREDAPLFASPAPDLDAAYQCHGDLFADAAE